MLIKLTFDTCGRFHNHVYTQLLRVWIPKVEKIQVKQSVLLPFCDLRVQKIHVKPR